MVRCFGYHLVYVDAIGVSAFFVHESTIGKEPLLSLADAQRASIQGGEYPPIHSPCVHHAWVRIDEGVDFTAASLDVGSLPLVVLGHKDSTPRVFYEVEVPAGFKDAHGSRAGQQLPCSRAEVEQLAASAPATLKRKVPGLDQAVAAGDFLSLRAVVLEDWSVALLVGMAFVCGVMLQRFGGQLLHACTSRSCQEATGRSSRV